MKGAGRQANFKRLAILLPVGPREPLHFVTDTLDSIAFHIGPEQSTVWIVDDTRKPDLCRAVKNRAGIELVQSLDLRHERASNRQNYGPLIANEIHALHRIRSAMTFDILLKMDVDALVTGDHPERNIADFFARHPRVGIVGAHRIRGDGSDKTHAIALKSRQLRTEQSFSRRFFRRLPHARYLHRLTARARRHGYVDGDTVTGGAYAMPYACAMAICQLDLEKTLSLRFSQLSEDTLMALCASACGFQLGDMPSSQNIFSVNWRGLPMPVDRVLKTGMKILHPVRGDASMPEADVRKFFQQARKKTERRPTAP